MGGIPSLRGSTLALGFVFLQEQKVWPKEKARQRILPFSALPPGINLGAHTQSLLAIFRQSCSRRNTHDSPGIQIKEQRGRTWIERQPLFNQKLGISLESYPPQTLEVGQLLKKGIGRKTPKYQMAQKI